MAISGGIDWVATQLALQQWVVGGTDLPDGSVYWGQQNRAKRPPEPAVEMRLSIIHEVGLPWLDVTPKFLSFAAKTVTAVSTLASTLTIPAHGLNTGDGPVQVASTLLVPSPLAPLTDYWAIRVDADTIRLAASFPDAVAGDPAGSAAVPITLLSEGSGVITLQSTPATLQAGHEIQYLARGVLHACLSLTCYTSVGVGMNMATSILRRIGSRRVLPAQTDILQGANIGLTSMERVLAIHGVTDAVRFEPRAFVEVYLNLASEEAADGTIINYVTGTNQITGQGFKLP